MSKSLLLSTMQAYFEGKRDLFKGLAIDTDEMGWEEHPIITFDFNAHRYYNICGITEEECLAALREI